MLTEKEAREKILESVAEYHRLYGGKKPYERGDRVNYAGRVYDSEELTALVGSSLDFWLTAGKYTAEFERGLAGYIGVKYASFVNSGSSANLLAFAALTSRELGDRAICRGDEVITVAAGFPTTVAPIVQYGAVPVFADITVPQYNIDVNALDGALSEKTKAVMIAHTLGNPFDISAVKAFCRKHNLWLIEDNCDALGSEYNENGEMKKTGSFGDIATLSFYPAHHITTGEGGAVLTNDAMLNKIIRSLRDWGRDCVCPSGRDNLCGHRFERQYGTLPRGYDHKYVYSNFGYNLKATDMQAAIGCAQLKKLPAFTEARRRNYRLMYDALSPLSGKLALPEPCPGASPSWFGFLMTCRTPQERDVAIAVLETAGIQTRMLFSGNITRHPCFETLREGADYRVPAPLTETDRVMSCSFWTGLYPGMPQDALAYTAEIIGKLLSE